MNPCPYCGAEVDDADIFMCEKCGTEICTNCADEHQDSKDCK